MNYVKITDYAAKDALLTGNPSKVVSGTEIGADFDAVATAVATKVDSGGALGTPSSGTLTNCTALPLTSGVTGTLPIANGGTAATTAAGAFTNIVAQGGNLTGAINEARGTVAIHATTMDIWTGKPTILDVTGTALTITDIADAPQAGARRILYFPAGTVLTDNATLFIEGNANYTIAAGDKTEIEAVTVSTFNVLITKANGTAVVVPAQIQTLSVVPSSNTLVISGPASQTDFRSSTLGSGVVTSVNAAPANFVISSGSTLGTVSGQLARIVVLEMNASGAKEWAVVNAASGLVLDETGLISTTAEGGAGAADSATTIYSATARSNVPYKVRGYFESTQATAGTWVTAPSLIQGAGGKEIITSRITTSATTATTSGTSIDITGIPPWAKRLNVILNGVSTSGTSTVQIQLGTASSMVTSGYVAFSSRLAGAALASTFITSGIAAANIVAATDTISGLITISNLSGTTWSSSGGAYLSTSNGSVTAGSIVLGGTADRIRLTTAGGADTFDAGSMTVTWE